LASAGFLLVPAVQAETGHDFTGALTGGKATLDMRLRSETVSQESKPEDASALTLRTRLGYLTITRLPTRKDRRRRLIRRWPIPN